jgi:hypothetical protein
MYQTLESRSGSTITMMTMMMTAATVAYGDIPKDAIQIKESIVMNQHYGDLYGVDPFAHSQKASFYAGLVKSNTSYMEPVQIVEHAIQQINTLSFIQVDEEIDREIDKYFASKHAKRVKKILHKRQS